MSKASERYNVFKFTGKSCLICGSHYADQARYDVERKGYAFLCEKCGAEIAFLEAPKPFYDYKIGE